MPIPNLPDFYEILSGVSLSPTKASDRYASVQIPFRLAVDVNGPVRDNPPLWLRYPAATKITFESLTQRINKELSAARHSMTVTVQGTPVHDRFAIFILALATLMPSQQGDIVERLNRILGSV